MIVRVSSYLFGSFDWWVESNDMLFFNRILWGNTGFEPFTVLIIMPLLSIEVLDLERIDELFSMLMAITSLLVNERVNLPFLGVLSRERGSPSHWLVIISCALTISSF